jgi:predicted nucleic acid-binding protein
VRRVIVDTSVFVDFFRGKSDPRFVTLLRSNSALLSPYVRLELLQGVRRAEARMLADLLGGIPQVPHRAELFTVAEKLVARLKGSGVNAGLVDLLIAAQAQILGCPVLSHDTVFGRLLALSLIKPL